MKTAGSASPFASLGAFLILFLLAYGSHYLDSNRVTGSRAAYEQFLKQTAMPFKNLSGNTKGDQVKADSPEMASLQEFFMTADPVQQRVPAERLPAAYHEMRALQTKQFKSVNAQLHWTGTGAEMGGRTRAIMWDPLVPNKVWAGGVTGGLWYNNDILSASGSWQPVNDMWDNLAISSIVYDSQNPLVMYVGTGEAPTAFITYRESSGRGVGIWKTVDGGQTWTLLSSTSQFAYVTQIVIRIEGGNSVIYAGVASGYYHGTQLSQPTDGLYRSANGGQTWEQVLPNITGYSTPYCVNEVVLGSGGRIYVGTMRNVDGKGGAVLLYSDTGLPGSWVKFETVAALIQANPQYPLPGRVTIAAAPSDSNIVYAAFGAGYHNEGNRPYYFGEYIYRSVNKGVTWQPVNLPGGNHDWANLSWHAMVLGVDPNNPNMIYAGGLDQWRSADGGNSWEHLSDWALMYRGGGDRYIHADQHAIEYKPGSSAIVLFGTDGGVFLSENGNAVTPVFKQRNKNFNTLQFYTGALNPTAGATGMIGGLQDNGCLLYKGLPLTINDMVSGGDGAGCFWDKENPTVFITSVYYNRYYIFQNNIQSYYINMYSGVFINPADYCSLYNTLYANACDFWGNGANTLLRVPSIPSNYQGDFLAVNTSSETYFSHVKVSPHSTANSHNLFLGTVSGQLFKVTKANTQPQATEIGSPLFPVGNISCVAVGGSEDSLLVTFSNYGVSSVWQTYNGGLSWREVEGNLPDMPVRWAIYHPKNARQALIATELGVWSTINLSENNVLWSPQTNGMANVRVDMLTLRTSDNTVLAASHGRGLFTATYLADLNTPVRDRAEAKNPFSVFVSQSGIEIQSAHKQAADYTVYSVSGISVIKGKIEAGAFYKTIHTGSLPRGVYLLVIRTGNTKYSKKVLLGG